MNGQGMRKERRIFVSQCHAFSRKTMPTGFINRRTVSGQVIIIRVLQQWQWSKAAEMWRLPVHDNWIADRAMSLKKDMRPSCSRVNDPVCKSISHRTTESETRRRWQGGNLNWLAHRGALRLASATAKCLSYCLFLLTDFGRLARRMQW